MPPPFRLTNEAYLRIPLGSGDSAINIFGSAWPTLTLRGTVAAGGDGSRPAFNTHLDVVGPRIVVRDPWFALTAAPVGGLSIIDRGDPAPAYRGTLGVEHSLFINTHGAPQPVVPRVGYGVSLGGASPAPYVSAGIDVPLARDSAGALTLGLGYRYDEAGGHTGTLSIGIELGDFFGTAYRGGLFAEPR